jgi:hypothetical protein
MNLNVLSRSFSTFVRNQKATWQWGAGDHQFLKSGKFERQQGQSSVRHENPVMTEARKELRIEDIKVIADRKYMYCKGCVRSQATRYKSNVVVAVEWLDEDHKALKTDWKRLETNLDTKPVPLLPDTTQPFLVQATLDRRVKWVKAYAFSANQ